LGRGSNFIGIKDVIASRRILPESAAKPQPDFIPEPLRTDYLESCRIKDLSPKASATLSRRCLQGMIRDFCGIKKGRLIDEITTLRVQVEDGSMASGVTVESVDAIDHVRSIGNIGAHMEKDIDLVIDVEPNEAQALIELIELLFDEWYIARRTRQDRLAAVQKIATAKKNAKEVSPTPDSENALGDSGVADNEAA